VGLAFFPDAEGEDVVFFKYHCFLCNHQIFCKGAKHFCITCIFSCFSIFSCFLDFFGIFCIIFCLICVTVLLFLGYVKLFLAFFHAICVKALLFLHYVKLFFGIFMHPSIMFKLLYILMITFDLIFSVQYLPKILTILLSLQVGQCILCASLVLPNLVEFDYHHFLHQGQLQHGAII